MPEHPAATKRPTADTLPALVLTLHMVPDATIASGNARGHWVKQFRDKRREKESWSWELLTALNGLPGKQPHYERLTVKVTCIYLTKRRRDQDNLMAALKPLWDAMVNLGLIPDDDTEHLTIETPVVLVDKRRGPVTVLELSWPEIEATLKGKR